MVCNASLGYLPSLDQMVAFQAGQGRPVLGAVSYALCANRDLIGCNWLCEQLSQKEFCQSCSHTIKIPDISDVSKRQRWSKLERAKRRLFYALIKHQLPLSFEGRDIEGTLRFELVGNSFHPDGREKRVMTGHDNGLITINIAEADDVLREQSRVAMGEPYRTLIGHFRHEVGHYYWDRLVDNYSQIERFRECFGDERKDYSEALDAYYKHGAPADWQQSYVSAYASAHPWEDFAETWAHYLHMVGGLETAYAYGLRPQPLQTDEQNMLPYSDPYHVSDFDTLINRWVPITVAMNAMNRSIGNSDYYPFAISQNVSYKLNYIHNLVNQHRGYGYN